MDEAHKELIAVGRKYADGVDKDRGFESGLTDCLRGLSDALEALEVNRDLWRDKCVLVEAERDRMKAALEGIASAGECILFSEGGAAELAEDARKALGDVS